MAWVNVLPRVGRRLGNGPRFNRGQSGGGFDPEKAEFAFMWPMENIFLGLQEDSPRYFFPGATECEALMQDISKIPENWRDYPRIGFGGESLVLRLPGLDKVDPFGALTLIRIPSSWTVGFLNFEDPAWTDTPIVRIPKPLRLL